MNEVAARFSKETLLYHQRLLDSALITMQSANALKRVTAEMALTRMCDETLNTGNEALLARIARLEEQMMSGAWRTSAVPVAEALRSEPPVQPQPQETVAPVVAPTEQPKVAPPAKSESGKKTLRPLRVWAEVVERLTAQAPMSASFVRTAHAYQTEDDKVLLRFENEFSLMMLDRDDTKDLLRGALSVCLRREVRESDLICQSMPKTETGCALDEIIEALED